MTPFLGFFVFFTSSLNLLFIFYIFHVHIVVVVVVVVATSSNPWKMPTSREMSNCPPYKKLNKPLGAKGPLPVGEEVWKKDVGKLGS
jgi:hypothetical protein